MKNIQRRCVAHHLPNNAGQAKNLINYCVRWNSFISLTLMSILQVQFHLMLYIQMQLCERSLKDWIQERNSTPKLELTMSTGKLNGLFTGIGDLLCIIGCIHFLAHIQRHSICIQFLYLQVPFNHLTLDKHLIS